MYSHWLEPANEIISKGKLLGDWSIFGPSHVHRSHWLARFCLSSDWPILIRGAGHRAGLSFFHFGHFGQVPVVVLVTCTTGEYIQVSIQRITHPHQCPHQNE